MPHGCPHYSKPFHVSFHPSASVVHSSSPGGGRAEHVQPLAAGITLSETSPWAAVVVGGWQQTEHEKDFAIMHGNQSGRDH